MTGREHYVGMVLPDRLSRKRQQHNNSMGLNRTDVKSHGQTSEHSLPWKPAGSISIHSTGTADKSFYAPLTSSHPSRPPSAQQLSRGSYCSNVSDKENEARSSRIFKSQKAAYSAASAPQTLRPSSCGRSRYSSGSGGSRELRPVLKAINGGGRSIGCFQRDGPNGDGGYSNVATSTFSISNGMQLANSSALSGTSNVSTVTSGCVGTQVFSGNSANSSVRDTQLHSLCGQQPHQPCQFLVMAQPHTSPVALRYAFQEPSSTNSATSSTNSSHSVRQRSPILQETAPLHATGNSSSSHCAPWQRYLQPEQATARAHVPSVLQQQPPQLSHNAPLSKHFLNTREQPIINDSVGRAAGEQLTDSCLAGAKHGTGSPTQQGQPPQGQVLQQLLQQLSSQFDNELSPTRHLEGCKPVLQQLWLPDRLGAQRRAEQEQRQPLHSYGNTLRLAEAPNAVSLAHADTLDSMKPYRLFLDQQVEPVEERSSDTEHQHQDDDQHQFVRRHPQQDPPTGSPHASLSPATAAAAAARSVTYQQLLQSCASMVQTSTAAWMQMHKYHKQRLSGPLGTPGGAARPLSRFGVQQCCGSPQKFFSLPGTPKGNKMVELLRMSSPASSALLQSPACTACMPGVPKFSHGMATQPPGILQLSPCSSIATLHNVAPLASPSTPWSLYLTPGLGSAAASSISAGMCREDAIRTAGAASGQMCVSKAVQTSPVGQKVSTGSTSGPWRCDAQQAEPPITCTPGIKVKPRVLFETEDASPVLMQAADGIHSSPAFPFGCRSSGNEAAQLSMACHRTTQCALQCSSPVSNTAADVTSDTEDCQGQVDGIRPDITPTVAQSLANSPLIASAEYGSEAWSVHNNALAWGAAAEVDAGAVGMRSMADAVGLADAANPAARDSTNSATLAEQAGRMPLQPTDRCQQQQPLLHNPSAASAVMVDGIENMTPAEALAAFTSLAINLKSQIDETAAKASTPAAAMPPVITRQDVGLVVLASPVAGCGRWQQGRTSPVEG